MKTITKIILFGAFLCGSLSQASPHQRLLSFDGLMSLNVKQRAAYIKTLREAFGNAEKDQLANGVTPEIAQNAIPKVPNFIEAFYSEAVASDDGGFCIYGASISSIHDGKCRGLPKDGCAAGKSARCNPFLFGDHCVAIPPNDTTKECTKETANIPLETIANGIKNTPENRQKWGTFKDELNNYCNMAVDNHWRSGRQVTLCATVVARTSDMQRYLDAKLGDVPAAKDPPLSQTETKAGCAFSFEGKSYHVDYGLKEGTFFTSVSVPEGDTSVSSQASSDCDKVTSLPATCLLYINRRESGGIQEYKLSGANNSGTANCTWEKSGDLQKLPSDTTTITADPPSDPECASVAGNIGDASQLFCVGKVKSKDNEPDDPKPFKAVTYQDFSPVKNGEISVRICESSGTNGPWYLADQYSTSDLAKRVNQTSMVTKHGRWELLGEGKQTIKMPVVNGKQVLITRYKPKNQKLTDGIQGCEFTDKTIAPVFNSIVEKTSYFKIDGLNTSDNLGTDAGRAQRASAR